MNFKEVQLAGVPAYAIFTDRLNVFRPNLAPVKAGHEFDSSIVRIYVETQNRIRFKVDVPDNLLNDLEANLNHGPSKYRDELIGQLDQILENAIPINE